MEEARGTKYLPPHERQTDEKVEQKDAKRFILKRRSIDQRKLIL